MIIGIVERGDRADHPDPMSVRLICAQMNHGRMLARTAP